MIKIYKSNASQNSLDEVKKIENNTWINLVNPSKEEIAEVANATKVDSEFLAYVLDEEEQSRIDEEDNTVLILVDIPYIEKTYNMNSVSTIPLGILLVSNPNEEYIITICLKETEVMKDFLNNKVKTFYTNKKSRFVIQILYKVAQSYLKHLRIIDKEIDKAERLLHKETKNSNLLQLLNVEKSLVYIQTSLKSNDLVLNYLLKGNTIPLYEEDKEILEDAIIENRQGIEMAQIYSAILGRLSSAFASIISNNLNDVMRFLAGITIVISIPTMIASFMGMNVPFGDFGKYPYAFISILALALVTSVAVAFILKKKDIL